MSFDTPIVSVSIRSSPATEQIVVLSDGETFSALAGARVFDVQANLSTEEIEECLREETLAPVIEFCVHDEPQIHMERRCPDGR